MIITFSIKKKHKTPNIKSKEVKNSFEISSSSSSSYISSLSEINLFYSTVLELCSSSCS